MLHHFGYLADLCRDHGDAASHVFKEFERREIEVVTQPRVGGQGQVKLSDHRRDLLVGQSSGKDNVLTYVPYAAAFLQLRPQLAVAYDEQLQFQVPPHKPLDEFRQHLDPMPWPQSADETDHRPVVQSQTRANGRLRSARLETRGIDTVWKNVHARWGDAQGNRVVANGGRNRQHGVRPRQRPALCLSSQLAQAGASVSALFDGQGRVEFQQMRHVQRTGDQGAGRSVKGGAFVNEIGGIAIEPAQEVLRQFLVEQDSAHLAGQ